MEKKIYETNEWKGYGKQNYYDNEYRQDGDVVSKYKCHRAKFFDGKENNWYNEERLLQSWKIDDPEMPEWLQKYLEVVREGECVVKLRHTRPS